jgi:hypothetical protein
MSYFGSTEWYVKVASGDIPGWSVVHKFGRNFNIGTTYSPVVNGGFYRTPQVGSATTLRVKAGNANDTAAGTGAREITLVGLNASGAEITETLATAGTSASANTSNSFIRLHRFWVSKSGTYATQTAGSHADDIVIENSAGTEDWATISATDFPRGQSQIAAYSIPSGKTGFINDIVISVDSNKSADISFFQRTLILETAAPYSGTMRVITEQTGITGQANIIVKTPINGFTGPCDIGFLSKVSSGTADVSIDFEILLKDS